MLARLHNTLSTQSQSDLALNFELQKLQLLKDTHAPSSYTGYPAVSTGHSPASAGPPRTARGCSSRSARIASAARPETGLVVVRGPWATGRAPAGGGVARSIGSGDHVSTRRYFPILRTM